MISMNFLNKVVLVTGSSRGIGRSIAVGFAKEGAHVVINYKNNQKEIVKRGMLWRAVQTTIIL